MSEKEQIVDAPIGPYSSPADIRAWIQELEQMEQTENVRLSLDEAKEWLRRQEEWDASH